MGEGAVLEVSGLAKRYGGFTAVHDLSFEVARGEVLGLCGPNGAGKTSTLRCLGGILPPTRGAVRVAGHDLASDPVAAKRELAFLPDEPRLFDYLTVREHLTRVARLSGVQDWEVRAGALLAELELDGKAGALPGELSRGMKQKLTIACGFLHDPKLILLDEPLTGLDPLGIRKMKRSLRTRAEAGAAIVLSSHLLPLVEELCHRVLVIVAGRAVALGTIAEIRAQLGSGGATGEPGRPLHPHHRHRRRSSAPGGRIPPVNALSALAFIAFATLRNMLLRQLRRVREPRYLAATLFGLFYVANVFLRPGLHAGREAARGALARGDLGGRPLLAAGLTGAGLVAILLGWIFGGDESGLAFSEAEIQFLFPAPLSRRQLVHYKLVRSLLLGLVSSAILTLSLGRSLARGSTLFILGAWLGVVTLSLHLIAASLTRTSLLDHGVRGPARRALALVVPAVLLGSTVAGFLRVPQHSPARDHHVAPYVEALQDTPPLSCAPMILAPAVHVALAPSLPELLRWLPAAFGVLALHYLWALSTDAAFEQASIAAAERRSKRIEGMRKGRLTVRAGARPPFRLSAHGPPAVAIYWKNLTAAVRVLSLRVALVVLAPVLAGVVATVMASGAQVNRGLAAIVCLLLSLSLAFFGVQIYRIDFRLDLENIDLLRSYPLRGRDLALAEVLAPFTVLTLGEWLFLVAAAALAPADFVAAAGRFPVACALMVALPAFTLCALIVQNAAALLFPAWIQSGTGAPRGVEAIGQRMVTLVGTLLAVSLALVPAALVAGAAGLLLRAPLGDAALPIAALAGGVVVAVEAGLGFLGLGRAFDRFDSAAR